jgi:hypothetical protein
VTAPPFARFFAFLGSTRITGRASLPPMRQRFFPGRLSFGWITSTDRVCQEMFFLSPVPSPRPARMAPSRFCHIGILRFLLRRIRCRAPFSSSRRFQSCLLLAIARKSRPGIPSSGWRTPWLAVAYAQEADRPEAAIRELVFGILREYVKTVQHLTVEREAH